MTQPAENIVTSDPIVAPVEPEAPVGDTPAPEVDAAPTKLQELSALAAAEKARWRERKALRAERQSYTQRSAQTESQLRAAQERLQQIEGMDVLDYAEQRGLTAEQLAQRVIRRGTTEHTVETLTEKIARLEKQAEARDEATRTERYQADMRAKEQEFYGGISAETHPVLADMDREAVIEKAHVLARKAVLDAERRGVRGFRVDPKKLAAHLEELEAAEEQKVLARAKGRLAGTTKDSASMGASNDNGRQGTTKAGTPRTLTNAGATERGSMPVNFDELSDAEQNKILAQKLREGWRG